MVNGIVFGGVRGVVSNAEFDADLIGEVLQVCLEEIMVGVVATAPITQDQERSGLRIVILPLVIPPIPQTVAGEFAGIFAYSQIDVAGVVADIINPMWNNHPFSEAGEIMVIDRRRYGTIHRTRSVEIAQQFLLLGIHTDNGLSCCCIRRFEPGNILKLLIALRAGLHGQFFCALRRR